MHQEDGSDAEEEEAKETSGTSLVTFHVVRTGSRHKGASLDDIHLELLPTVAGIQPPALGNLWMTRRNHTMRNNDNATPIHLAIQQSEGKKRVMRTMTATLARALLVKDETYEAWGKSAAARDTTTVSSAQAEAGWVSDRSCRFPQEIGLRLINTGKGSIVRCLLITALRHMLPRYIDIYASPEDPEARQHLAADTSGAQVRAQWSRAYQRALFTFRMRVHFNPSDEQGNSTSPCLVTRMVPIRIPACCFLRLVVHEPWQDITQNPYHQLGLHSVYVIGTDTLASLINPTHGTPGSGVVHLLDDPRIDAVSSMRAAVMRELGVSPTIIETVIFRQPRTQSAPGAGKASGKAGPVEVDRPFSSAELRREELQFVLRELRTWQGKYLLQLPSAAILGGVSEQWIALRGLEDRVSKAAERASPPAPTGPIPTFSPLSAKAPAPTARARAFEAKRAEVELTDLVKQAGVLIRTLNMRMAPNFREVVWGPAAKRIRRRKVGAAKARGGLEEEEEDTDEEEEDHTLGPLLSQQLGDICGVSAALHKGADAKETDQQWHNNIKAPALLAYRSTLECLVGASALETLVNGSKKNVHAADVLRVCESHVLEMIEAVSQLLLVAAQPLLQQIGAGNKKALTQAQELHAKAARAEAHRVVFRAQMALVMEGMRSDDMATFRAAAHLMQTLLEGSRQPAPKQPSPQPSPTATGAGDDKGKGKKGKKGDKAVTVPVPDKPPEAPDKLEGLTLGAENLRVSDMLWALDDLCFVLCRRCANTALDAMVGQTPAKIVQRNVPLTVTVLSTEEWLADADNLLLFLCDQPHLGPWLVSSRLLYGCPKDMAGRMLLHTILLEEYGVVEHSALSERASRELLVGGLTHAKAPMRLLSLDLLLRLDGCFSPAVLEDVLNHVEPPVLRGAYSARVSSNVGGGKKAQSQDKPSVVTVGPGVTSRTGRVRQQHTSHVAGPLTSAVTKRVRESITHKVEEMRKSAIVLLEPPPPLEVAPPTAETVHGTPKAKMGVTPEGTPSAKKKKGKDDTMVAAPSITVVKTPEAGAKPAKKLSYEEEADDPPTYRGLVNTAETASTARTTFSTPFVDGPLHATASSSLTQRESDFLATNPSLSFTSTVGNTTTKGASASRTSKRISALSTRDMDDGEFSDEEDEDFSDEEDEEEIERTMETPAFTAANPIKEGGGVQAARAGVNPSFFKTPADGKGGRPDDGGSSEEDDEDFSDEDEDFSDEEDEEGERTMERPNVTAANPVKEGGGVPAARQAANPNFFGGAAGKGKKYDENAPLSAAKGPPLSPKNAPKKSPAASPKNAEGGKDKPAAPVAAGKAGGKNGPVAVDKGDGKGKDKGNEVEGPKSRGVAPEVKAKGVPNAKGEKNKAEKKGCSVM